MLRVIIFSKFIENSKNIVYDSDFKVSCEEQFTACLNEQMVFMSTWFQAITWVISVNFIGFELFSYDFLWFLGISYDGILNFKVL